MSHWRANQDALIDAGVGPDDAEPLMNPRDARYDYPYTLEQAKEHALWEVGGDPPSTIQALLDRMVHHCWTDDDLNRRAVLYLLDDGLLVIDREQRRVRLA